MADRHCRVCGGSIAPPPERGPRAVTCGDECADKNEKAKARERKQRPEAKAKARERQQRPEFKAKARERKQRPEAKAKARERQQRPEAKAKARERQQRPEFKAKARERKQRPEAKAKARERQQRPEAKAKARERQQQPKYKAKAREREQRPEYKAKKREWEQQTENKAKKQERMRERYHRMGGYGYRRHLPDLLARDGWRCGLCGGSLQGEDQSDIHVDHIKPVSKGGDSRPDNLQPAHAHCNKSKSDRELHFMRSSLYIQPLSSSRLCAGPREFCSRTVLS